jgi:hypothetical protein
MRTLLIRNTPEADPPPELYDIIRNGSTVILVTEAPDEGFRLCVDRVVVWNDPELTVDDRTLWWPADADEVRLLFESAE